MAGERSFAFAVNAMTAGAVLFEKLLTGYGKCITARVLPN